MTKCINLLDDDGENQAVRMFLLLYGQPGLTVAHMREHMESAGWPQVPEWATKPEAQGRLTKAGAQSWLRHLFALENPYVVMPPLSEADEAKLLDALKNSQPMGFEPAPAGPDGHVLYGDWDKDAPESIRDRNGQVCLALCRVCGKAEAELTPGERCSGKERP